MNFHNSAGAVDPLLVLGALWRGQPVPHGVHHAAGPELRGRLRAAYDLVSSLKKEDHSANLREYLHGEIHDSVWDQHKLKPLPLWHSEFESKQKRPFLTLERKGGKGFFSVWEWLALTKAEQAQIKSGCDIIPRLAKRKGVQCQVFSKVEVEVEAEVKPGIQQLDIKQDIKQEMNVQVMQTMYREAKPEMHRQLKQAGEPEGSRWQIWVEVSRLTSVVEQRTAKNKIDLGIKTATVLLIWWYKCVQGTIDIMRNPHRLGMTPGVPDIRDLYVVGFIPKCSGNLAYTVVLAYKDQPLAQDPAPIDDGSLEYRPPSPTSLQSPLLPLNPQNAFAPEDYSQEEAVLQIPLDFDNQAESVNVSTFSAPDSPPPFIVSNAVADSSRSLINEQTRLDTNVTNWPGSVINPISSSQPEYTVVNPVIVHGYRREKNSIQNSFSQQYQVNQRTYEQDLQELSALGTTSSIALSEPQTISFYAHPPQDTDTQQQLEHNNEMWDFRANSYSAAQPHMPVQVQLEESRPITGIGLHVPQDSGEQDMFIDYPPTLSSTPYVTPRWQDVSPRGRNMSVPSQTGFQGYTLSDNTSVPETAAIWANSERSGPPPACHPRIRGPASLQFETWARPTSYSTSHLPSSGDCFPNTAPSVTSSTSASLSTAFNMYNYHNVPNTQMAWAPASSANYASYGHPWNTTNQELPPDPAPPMSQGQDNTWFWCYPE